jgi:hypothetical protein
MQTLCLSARSQLSVSVDIQKPTERLAAHTGQPSDFTDRQIDLVVPFLRTCGLVNSGKTELPLPDPFRPRSP